MGKKAEDRTLFCLRFNEFFDFIYCIIRRFRIDQNDFKVAEGLTGKRTQGSQNGSRVVVNGDDNGQLHKNASPFISVWFYCTIIILQRREFRLSFFTVH